MAYVGAPEEGFHVTICRSIHERRTRRKRPGDGNLSEVPGDRRFKRSQCNRTGKEKVLRNRVALRLVAACRPNPDQGRRFSILKSCRGGIPGYGGAAGRAR